METSVTESRYALLPERAHSSALQTGVLLGALMLLPVILSYFFF